jgi:undecaprenyl-diphosphatase
MIDNLVSIDRDLFLFLNGLHSTWLDPVMLWISNALVWIPFYVVLLYLVYRRYGMRALWVLLVVALMIGASDQLANLFKDGVHRLRPSQDPALAGVHIVNGYRGGMYGFYSAHASNTFALAIFLITILHRHFRWIAWLLAPWAFLLSYSRIYLGVHYPGDMAVGMVVGVLLGLGFGFGFLRLNSSINPQAGS